MEPFYATREQVSRSLEISQSANIDWLIDQKIGAASRSLEGFLHRRFYPERRTILRDWPNNRSDPTWSIYLDDNELISISAVLSAGTNITANCMLRRGDDKTEPPYTSLEVSLGSNAAFSAGTTFQQAISITGLFGHNDTVTDLAGAALSGAINGSVTTIKLIPSSGYYTVGVGSIILIDAERMILMDRQLVTTGETTGGAITAAQNDRVIACGGASNFAKGEIILVDGERMRINDIVPGASLIVSRAWDGTPLAAHNIGATIYALRNFIVKRGALGSTASAHADLASVYVHEFPALINELCIAESVVLIEQNAGGYARVIGSGESARESVGKGLEDVRDRAWRAYGRKSRKQAI